MPSIHRFEPAAAMIHHPMYDAVLAWARREPAIRALVITGSLARADGSTDAFSDLDAQIITAERERYTKDDSWLDALGEVWIRFPLHKDAPYRLVWFAGGLKVDFQFIDPAAIRQPSASGSLSDEYRRGYLVALDKDGLFRELPPSPRVFPAPPPPSQAEVEATINEFSFEAIHVAQFIRRREFWVVKSRDWTMKTMLLRLLEWHARATSGPALNTWLLGKRIGEWADADAREAIPQIWSSWDGAELWTGLSEQLKLFRRLSRELCAALGYQYDESRHRQIDAYIQRLRADDELKA